MRTKEINAVSHIISVWLVVIARKKENILCQRKALTSCLFETGQSAIVQQQKSSADVKTAINVGNITFLFLLLTKHTKPV